MLYGLATANASDDPYQLAIQPFESYVPCYPGIPERPDCPAPDAKDDKRIQYLYDRRTWRHSSKLPADPIDLATRSRTPVQHARTKIIGPTLDDGLLSLAVKLWMIESAKYTVDVAYYIFTRDEAGYAVLGALCNAVRRGVDVRIVVDSIGSMHPSHSELRALETCADEAGFMRNDAGQVTTTRARVQTVIFNALSKPSSWANRRSHDKVLITDGHFPADAIVLTGGRNVSLAYYGIHNDGSPDPTAYRDVEILLRPDTDATLESVTVGNVSEVYYSIVFLNKGNKRIYPANNPDTEKKQRARAQQSLAFFMQHPEIAKKMADMDAYMTQGFRDSKVRLAHELDNLVNVRVTTDVRENKSQNPNSITYILFEIAEAAQNQAAARRGEPLRIVSPYLFVVEYYDSEGKLVLDGAQAVHDWMREHPDARLEIITNSVLTSDNIFAQSIIDMDMAPRLLLPPELRESWLSGIESGELNPQLVESEAWKAAINHPQIFIYETGRLDSVKLGGNTHFGKLHAKYITGGQYGFVGTSNFDYRSRLYNNEMGFFFDDAELSNDLEEIFEQLKATSYRWGTPEWLEMRRKVMAKKGMKSWMVRHQRGLYKFMKATGLDWLI
jgi:phosphatidylserine/phosphatidylglycerophosphate/cardiolipin synthase-like enzyme